MPPSRASLDPRDMKAAYVVSDENGYYDSQNIVSLGGGELSGVLHHSRNHEGGKGGREGASVETRVVMTHARPDAVQHEVGGRGPHLVQAEADRAARDRGRLRGEEGDDDMRLIMTMR